MSDTFDPNQYLATSTPVVNSANVPVDTIQEQQFDPAAYVAGQNSADFSKLQAKYGGAENTALAGLAAAARGASLGTSDVLLRGAGVDSEILRGLQEAHPIVSGGANLLGNAALLAGTGGLGGITEGASVASRLAGNALLGGGLEAGTVVSDLAMGDPTLNAQKIATRLGTGALFGLGLGGLSEVTKIALPKATEGINAALEKLKGMAVGTEEAPGFIQQKFPSWSEKFNAGLKNGIDGQPVKPKEMLSTLQDLHNSVTKATKAMYEEAAPANLQDALKDMPINEAKGLVSDTVEGMKSVINGAGEAPALSSPASYKIVSSEINDLENTISKSKSAYDVHEALSDFAKKIDSKKIIKFDTIPTAANQSDQEVLHYLRDNIRNDLKDPTLWGEAGPHYEAVSDTYREVVNARKNFQKDFMTARTSETGQKKYVIDPVKATRFFNNFNEPSQELKKASLDNFMNAAKRVAGESESYEGFIKGSDSASEHINALSKKNEELAKLAEIMSSKSPSSNISLGQGIGAHIAGTLGVPDVLTGGALGIMKAVKSIANPYELGSNLHNAVSKLKTMGDMIQKTNKTIESSAKSIFSGNNARAVSGGLLGATEKQYDRYSDKIKELANDQSILQNHLEKTTNGISEIAPNISSGLHSTIMNGVQFLNSKIPHPSNSLPLNSPWTASPSQKVKFMKYSNAVHNPLHALNDIKNGSLSSETMEALQAVHPDLLQSMRQAVMENMNPKKISSLNYSTKIALGKFMGQPMESAMQPQVIASNQAALQMPSSTSPKDAQQGQKRGRSTLGGMKELDLGNRTLTRTEHLEKEPV